MSNILSIRKRLGMSQAALGEAIGCTQGNVGHYERGQTVPPEMARRLIRFAASRGVVITFDDVYGEVAAAATDVLPSISAVGAGAAVQIAQQGAA